jgi:acetyl esterase/lipase
MGRFSRLLPRLIAIAVVVTVPLLLTNCRDVASGVINAPSYAWSYVRHASIAYGALPRQSLDVYVPGGAVNRPVVVFWHGGTWMRGSKEEVRFVGAALADAGYVAIVPDYRLIPQIRFPLFIEDGALAVKWAREHARELGGDPNAIFLMGHSAGGYLAAMLALDEHYLEEAGGDADWIRGWIGVSAPYEMPYDLHFARIFLGVTGAAKWRPIDLVSERAPPALLVHGMEDRYIHPREVANFQAKLREAGASADCRIYDDVGHLGTVVNISLALPWLPATLTEVQAFIDGIVAGAPPSARDTSCPSFDGRKGSSGLRPQIPYRLPNRAGLSG